MAHLLKGGTCFNHIAKTGGEWVMAALREGGVYDCRLGSGKWSSHTIKWKRNTFCFVRHPYTYMQSWHAYRVQKYGAKRVPSTDLNETVKILYETKPDMISSEFEKYTTPQKGCRCFVGQQEHLLEHLLLILEMCHEDFGEPEIRACRPKNITNNKAALTDESKQMLDKMGKSVIDNYYAQDNRIVVLRA